MNVKMSFLLKISLNRDSICVNVVHNQHFLDWYWLTSHKAWTKVYSGGAELDTWLTGTPSKLEIVFWTTYDLKLELVVLEMVLTDWQVSDFEFDFFSFWYATGLWRDRDILIDLSLPDEIKVELTTILKDDCLCLPLIDEELAEVKLMWLTGLHLYAA
jgi:hypothetical protein